MRVAVVAAAVVVVAAAAVVVAVVVVVVVVVTIAATAVVAGESGEINLRDLWAGARECAICPDLGTADHSWQSISRGRFWRISKV